MKNMTDEQMRVEHDKLRETLLAQVKAAAERGGDVDMLMMNLAVSCFMSLFVNTGIRRGLWPILAGQIYSAAVSNLETDAYTIHEIVLKEKT